MSFVCHLMSHFFLPLKSFPYILLVYKQCVLFESRGSVPGKAGQSALMNLRPVPEQLCGNEIALAFLDSELIG